MSNRSDLPRELEKLSLEQREAIIGYKKVVDATGTRWEIVFREQPMKAGILFKDFLGEVLVNNDLHLTMIRRDFALSQGLEIQPWPECHIPSVSGNSYKILGVVNLEFLLIDKANKAVVESNTVIPVVSHMEDFIVIGQNTIDETRAVENVLTKRLELPYAPKNSLLDHPRLNQDLELRARLGSLLKISLPFL